MDDCRLLIDRHNDGHWQGPGGDAETEFALNLADVGCGTGAFTLVLARLLPYVRITARDFLQEFLDVLEQRAAYTGVADRVTLLARSMDDLPFTDKDWMSFGPREQSITSGLEKGVVDWRSYLRSGGLLLVSEITWITGSRPQALQHHWDSQHPEIPSCGKARLFTGRVFYRC